MDTNSLINMNDWLEDCTPSQCQMAHMLIDATPYTNNELHRFAETRHEGDESRQSVMFEAAHDRVPFVKARPKATGVLQRGDVRRKSLSAA